MSRHLHLRHAGSPLAISYERRGDRIVLERGERRVEAEVRRDGIWTETRIDSLATRCAVARGRRGVWVSCRGRTWLLEEEHADSGQGAASADELRAPMSGRVAQVVAKPGDAVSAGDLLVSIEAMKMEFRLIAPEESVVGEVRCAAGDRVELGDVLVVLKPKESAP